MAGAGPHVFGIGLDPETRCAHYSSALDVIAIKMKCCGRYYACKDCHDALERHVTEVWPIEEREQLAVLCGACKSELTIRQYLDCSNICPHCQAPFNPRCRYHYHFYFQGDVAR
jgi:uncharacterized CHY-type Zn-finger protein